MTKQKQAIKWAEYVLPIWEKSFPEDDRPRKAIEAAKTGAADAAAASAAAASAAYAAAYAAAAASAAYAAAAADAAAASAAYADAYAASAAAAAAAAAASSIFLESFGDPLKVKKCRLLKLSHNGIKWLEHEPEEFWDVLLRNWVVDSG